MSDAAQTARTARESLARGLQALQSDPSIPPPLVQLAPTVAQAMGALHQIERSNGMQLVPHAGVALESVRTALAQLQAQPPVHPAVGVATEAVASSLGLVHALNKLAGQAPAAQAGPPPAPAPRPSPAAGAPGATSPMKAPAPPVPQATSGSRGYPQSNAGGGGGISVAHAGAGFVGHTPQQAAQPPQQPQPQPAFPQPAPYAPPPPPAYVAPPPPAYVAPPPPAYVAPPPAYAQQPYAAPPAAQVARDPFAAPAPDPFAAPRPDAGPPGDAAVISADLGAQSPTNFYKGLAGNDIIEHGGLFVSTYMIPKLGTRVRLKVSLPGGYEFEVDGVVRWRREPSDAGSDAPPGFGAQITRIAPESRQLIYRYVRNREPLFHDDL